MGSMVCLKNKTEYIIGNVLNFSYEKRRNQSYSLDSALSNIRIKFVV